jgi:hypothetical protein
VWVVLCLRGSFDGAGGVQARNRIEWPMSAFTAERRGLIPQDRMWRVTVAGAGGRHFGAARRTAAHE